MYEDRVNEDTRLACARSYHPISIRCPGQSFSLHNLHRTYPLQAGVGRGGDSLRRKAALFPWLSPVPGPPVGALGGRVWGAEDEGKLVSPGAPISDVDDVDAEREVKDSDEPAEPVGGAAVRLTVDDSIEVETAEGPDEEVSGALGGVDESFLFFFPTVPPTAPPTTAPTIMRAMRAIRSFPRVLRQNDTGRAREPAPAPRNSSSRSPRP